MVGGIQLDQSSSTPLYRQLYAQLRTQIINLQLEDGARLPATRELAGLLGLNRTTVAAAYELLETDGLLRGHVGRGSFVAHKPLSDDLISFASSRPAQSDFPVHEFKEACREVIESPAAAAILQLGSPFGYAPLRDYLLRQAREEGTAGPDDDVLITSGCQQALDLLQRTLSAPGECVALEDPVYLGTKHVFARGGNRLVTVPAAGGVEQIARVLASERPSLLVITPNFQNPTGETMSLNSRRVVLDAARRFGTTIVENDMYRELRYSGEDIAPIKSLRDGADVILIRSFSKIAFPGLRVGWVVAPKEIVARLAEARQWCDLHTDQLSQAVFLRFADSGRLHTHLERVRVQGAERLRAVLAGCERHLPPGSVFTKPEGGMSLWVRLPSPLDAAELLPRVQRERVSYMPGKHFAVSQFDAGTLRLSFGSLTPEEIELGLSRLGKVFAEELGRRRSTASLESAVAVV